MRKTLRLTAFSEMGPAERDRALTDLMEATRTVPNGEIVELDARIHGYEIRHGIKSAALLSGLAAGSIAETHEICVWLADLKLRDRLGRLASRA